MEDRSDEGTQISVLKAYVKDFIEKRNWQKYHNPKDIAIAISVEAAELLDIFKWKQNDYEKIKVEEEVADVMIYLFSLANVMSIDLTKAVLKKLEKNEAKYPISKRLEAMKVLAKEDIYVQTRVSPIIPELTDNLEDMRELFKALKEAGARDIIVEYLRYNPFIKKWMTSSLRMEPDYIDKIYLRAYRGCSGTFPDCCKRNQARFGCGWNGRPKMISGYFRMPLRLKLEKYKAFKSKAEKEGLRFYVCSEEFPEINDCVNCCGIKGEKARKYLRFKYDNEACANTLACFIRERGEVFADDVLQAMFSIDEETFKKQFAKLDKYLVNVKRSPLGGWLYDQNFPV